jgi:SAM-dependent methyltransferase
MMGATIRREGSSMSEFNVNEYWLKRGRSYIREQRLDLEYHRLQERFLFEVLGEVRPPMQTILELGCGFGRVTRLLAGHFPEAQITALDLSPDQLDHARTYCASLGNIGFQQYDFYAGAPFPGSGYDAVIAIEVLLHHPPAMVGNLIAKLSDIARLVVNIDWSENWPWKTPEHVWVHDYKAIYEENGLTCATFVLPEKVEGKQQKLFIAGKELPSAISELETRIRQAAPREEDSRSVPASSEATPFNAEAWLQQLQVAQEELLKLIPAGSSFILVDDEQWGADKALPERQAIPFLEREGRYWGPPADDATAIGELDRLRLVGAAVIAFAWPSFWWFEHYKTFHGHLRASFPCLLENQRLVVFKLSP